jgi:DNA-binding XRE family transcriptional regulator
LFDDTDPEQVRAALHRLDAALLLRLSGQLERALRGDRAATRLYVRDYRTLTWRLMDEAHTALPDRFADTAPKTTVLDARGRPARALHRLLVYRAAESPFTVWTASFALGDAVGIDLTSRFRELLGRRAVDYPPAGSGEGVPLLADDRAAARFLTEVYDQLRFAHDPSPVERAREAFDLSKTELAELFGVSRQAVDRWIETGVPGDRQEKLSAMLSLADLLERKLKPGRLPGIARRPADAYDGETMLALIRDDRHQELLDKVRASFEWDVAA